MRNSPATANGLRKIASCNGCFGKCAPCRPTPSVSRPAKCPSRIREMPLRPLFARGSVNCYLLTKLLPPIFSLFVTDRGHRVGQENHPGRQEREQEEREHRVPRNRFGARYRDLRA